jgi:hypothetical protein
MRFIETSRSARRPTSVRKSACASALRPVAGGLAFPAPSSTLAVSSRALEGVPFASSLPRQAGLVDLRVLDVLFKALQPSRNPRRTPHRQAMQAPNAQPKPVARNPKVPPLMGFVRLFPFADIPGARPLPRAESEDKVRFGPAVPTANHVPSSRFLTASTGCSVLQAAGLLRPAASRRVHCVLRPMVARAPEAPPRRMSETVGPAERAPQCGSHPPKSSPRQQPYRITAAVALLSLPPRGTTLAPLQITRCRVIESIPLPR